MELHTCGTVGIHQALWPSLQGYGWDVEVDMCQSAGCNTSFGLCQGSGLQGGVVLVPRSCKRYRVPLHDPGHGSWGKGKGA